MKITVLFKALSDPNRVRALCALRQQELCVCQIVELLKLAPSTVSKHMSILAQAGLVESQKKGRWVYYRPATNEDFRVQQLLELLPELTRPEPQLQEDQQALSRILTLDPETLCRLQNDTSADNTD